MNLEAVLFAERLDVALDEGRSGVISTLAVTLSDDHPIGDHLLGAPLQGLGNMLGAVHRPYSAASSATAGSTFPSAQSPCAPVSMATQ